MECNPISPVSPGLASVSSPHLTFGHLPAVQQIPQIRDPEWLKVEVCREFQRGMCTRTDECRYAHPDKHIQITDGKVTACFDALKGRCNRESCKYLHPTHLLKQHLEFNGRQTLLHNRAMLQQMLPIQPNVMQAVQPGSLVGYEQVAGAAQPATLTSLHPNLYAHTAAAGQAYSVLPTDLSSLNHHLMYYPVAATPTHHPHQLLTQHHLQQHPHQQVAAMLPSVAGQRADKLEVCRDFQRGNCTRGEFECRYGHPPDRSMIDTTDNTVTVCMDCIKGRCTRDKCKYFHPPAHLQAKIRAAQNPAVTATMLPSMSPAAIASPQPVVAAPKRLLTWEDVLSNGGGALGQPPLKRHALESASIITSSGSSPGLACPSPTMSLTTQHHASSTQSSLAALYGYPAGLTSMSMPQAATPTAYYQQAMPMLQLYGTGSTLQSAGQAAAQASGQIAAAQSGTAHQLLNLQATLHQQHSSAAAAANTNGSSAAPSYALLDARNQGPCCLKR